MENRRNFQKELDQLLLNMEKRQETGTKSLLLHSCCAPCSSYCLEYLRQYFRITVFYYNPNITAEPEYRKRVAEQKRLIAAYNEMLRDGSAGDSNVMNMINVIEGDYVPQEFYDIAKGREDCPEGGERCFACYALRLGRTAELAKEKNFDYFATTLTISPLKNATKLNEIGEKLAQVHGVSWLPSDFKKKNGYKRSLELSEQYSLYRQDYCGCIYSRQERAAKSLKI